MRTHRLTIATLATALTIIAAAPAAQAHVKTTSRRYCAGSTATLTFKVPHGCAGSPTTKIELKLPPE